MAPVASSECFQTAAALRSEVLLAGYGRQMLKARRVAEQEQLHVCITPLLFQGKYVNNPLCLFKQSGEGAKLWALTETSP